MAQSMAQLRALLASAEQLQNLGNRGHCNSISPRLGSKYKVLGSGELPWPDCSWMTGHTEHDLHSRLILALIHKAEYSGECFPLVSLAQRFRRTPSVWDSPLVTRRPMWSIAPDFFWTDHSQSSEPRWLRRAGVSGGGASSGQDHLKILFATAAKKF
jgi:hypothetical protein